ncbi:hypothetical protein BU14_0494s0007 [Porphyra umbilicalis]|uniref:Uncharacterized protein n=1 Tax=Porphyra umbilicalis TaxID=2786 RepID=A0A1X6NTZ0_PORUM|nr:hypothetical protein BU14_0494s0007 [Porphyra umbilicalis]|eukprot:OSX71853.1 hypothetical protein BU14_0494s0007 [Porphyra umbilicalis]
MSILPVPLLKINSDTPHALPFRRRRHRRPHHIGHARTRLPTTPASASYADHPQKCKDDKHDRPEKQPPAGCLPVLCDLDATSAFPPTANHHAPHRIDHASDGARGDTDGRRHGLPRLRIDCQPHIMPYNAGGHHSGGKCGRRCRRCRRIGHRRQRCSVIVGGSAPPTRRAAQYQRPVGRLVNLMLRRPHGQGGGVARRVSRR